MAKIQKITSERDKLIEKLIDDKNSLYMINKKLKKEIEVYKSQNEYLNRKCKALTKNYREMLDEKLKDKTKKGRSKDS
tara:strand:- start:483 stop:716 length:234 start_codon:yes stop_codon:yes gene_type:complete